LKLANCSECLRLRFYPRELAKLREYTSCFVVVDVVVDVVVVVAAAAVAVAVAVSVAIAIAVAVAVATAAACMQFGMK
jgi:hypothetical protein